MDDGLFAQEKHENDTKGGDAMEEVQDGEELADAQLPEDLDALDNPKENHRKEVNWSEYQYLTLNAQENYQRTMFESFAKQIRSLDEVPWFIIWMEKRLNELSGADNAKMGYDGKQPECKTIENLEKEIEEQKMVALKKITMLSAVAMKAAGLGQGEEEINDLSKQLARAVVSACGQTHDMMSEDDDTDVKSKEKTVKKENIDHIKDAYVVSWIYTFMRQILDRKDTWNVLIKEGNEGMARILKMKETNLENCSESDRLLYQAFLSDFKKNPFETCQDMDKYNDAIPEVHNLELFFDNEKGYSKGVVQIAADLHKERKSESRWKASNIEVQSMKKYQITVTPRNLYNNGTAPKPRAYNYADEMSNAVETVINMYDFDPEIPDKERLWAEYGDQDADEMSNGVETVTNVYDLNPEIVWVETKDTLKRTIETMKHLRRYCIESNHTYDRDALNECIGRMQDGGDMEAQELGQDAEDEGDESGSEKESPLFEQKKDELSENIEQELGEGRGIPPRLDKIHKLLNLGGGLKSNKNRVHNVATRYQEVENALPTFANGKQIEQMIVSKNIGPFQYKQLQHIVDIEKEFFKNIRRLNNSEGNKSKPWYQIPEVVTMIETYNKHATLFMQERFKPSDWIEETIDELNANMLLSRTLEEIFSEFVAFEEFVYRKIKKLEEYDVISHACDEAINYFAIHGDKNISMILAGIRVATGRIKSSNSKNIKEYFANTMQAPLSAEGFKELQQLLCELYGDNVTSNDKAFNPRYLFLDEIMLDKKDDVENMDDRREIERLAKKLGNDPLAELSDEGLGDEVKTNKRQEKRTNNETTAIEAIAFDEAHKRGGDVPNQDDRMIEECSKMTSKDMTIFVKDSQAAFYKVKNWTFDITGVDFADNIHTIAYLFRGFQRMAEDIFISDVRMVSADTDKSLVTSQTLDEVEKATLFLSRIARFLETCIKLSTETKDLIANIRGHSISGMGSVWSDYKKARFTFYIHSFQRWVQKTILQMDLYTQGVRDVSDIVPNGLKIQIFHHLTIRRYDLIRDLVLYSKILSMIRKNFKQFVTDNGTNPGNVETIQTLVKTLSEEIPEVSYEFQVDFEKHHEEYQDWNKSKSWDAIRKDYGISTVNRSEYDIEELYDHELMKAAFPTSRPGGRIDWENFSSYAEVRERKIRKWALDCIAEDSLSVFGGTRKINYKKWWSPDERTFERWWSHPWEWTIQMDNSMWFMPGFNNKGDTNVQGGAKLYSEESATKDLAYRMQKMSHMSTIVGVLVNNILDIEKSYGPKDFQYLETSLRHENAETDVIFYCKETMLTCEQLRRVHLSWKVEYPNAYKNSTCIWKYGFDGNSKDWDVESMGPHPITVYAQSFRNLNSYCSIMNSIMIDMVELLQHCTVVTMCVDLWQPPFGAERVEIDSPTYVYASREETPISNDCKQLTEQIVQCLEKVDLIRKPFCQHANKMRKMFTPSYLFMQRNKSNKNISFSLRVDGPEFRKCVVENQNTGKLLSILGDNFRDDITQLYTGIQSVIHRFNPMDTDDTILQDLGYRTAIAFDKHTQLRNSHFSTGEYDSSFKPTFRSAYIKFVDYMRTMVHHMGLCRIARDYIRRQELKKNEKDRAKPSGFIGYVRLNEIFDDEGTGKPGEEIEGGDTENDGDTKTHDAAQETKQTKNKKKPRQPKRKNKQIEGGQPRVSDTTVGDTEMGGAKEEKPNNKRMLNGKPPDIDKKHKTGCKFPKVGSLRSGVGGKRLVFLIT